MNAVLPEPVLGERWYLAARGVHVEVCETRTVAGHLYVRATPIDKAPHWTDWMPWRSLYLRIKDGTALPSGSTAPMRPSAGRGRDAKGPEGVPSATPVVSGLPDPPATTNDPKEVTMSDATATPEAPTAEAKPDPKSKQAEGRSAARGEAAKPSAPKADKPAAEEKPSVDVGGLEKELLAAVKAEVRGLQTTKKASYTRLNGKDTKAIGYVTPSKKGLRVEIPNGSGGYDVVKVTEASQIEKAAKPMIALANAKKDA